MNQPLSKSLWNIDRNTTGKLYSYLYYCIYLSILSVSAAEVEICVRKKNIF